MDIYLGNLSVKQMEKRLGIILKDEDVKVLNSMREDNAQNIADDKWHCFDIPFAIRCGSMDAAIIVRDILSPYSDKMKCKFNIIY